MAETRSVDLDQTLARTGDGAFVIGAEGRILLWNRAAEKIMGYTPREAVGRPCCEVFVGLDSDGNRLCYQGCHVMNLVKLSEPIHSFDMQTRTKAGQVVWINVSILASAANGKTGPLTIHLFRDVTASKELLRLVHERLNPTTAEAPPPADVLTRRELEVLRLVTLGVGTAQAAERLNVSPATVRNHIQNIFAKLGVHSRLEAVVHATKHRLV